MPLNVQPFCAVVVWEKPSFPNGKITGYDVMFTFLHSASIVIRVEGEITYYVITIPIPPGAMQIKASLPFVNIIIIFESFHIMCT